MDKEKFDFIVMIVFIIICNLDQSIVIYGYVSFTTLVGKIAYKLVKEGIHKFLNT